MRSDIELVATFYEPGDVESVARTVRGFGGEAVVAVEVPSGLASSCSRRVSRYACELGVPEGLFERHRV